ncbi:MAG: serine acetyltransferase [Bacteroidales bacterium]|nr:serine acetyltransferase [Bacteroidales bacterium]
MSKNKKSLKQTGERLRRLMVAVKDAVFPLYSDITPEEALRIIRESLEDLTDAQTTQAFLDGFPEIKRLILTDVEAIAHIDPAAADEQEIIFCYPAVTAMLHYRTAHLLYTLGVGIIPRMLTEHAHSVTGIDIHPATTIGEYFAIDHGTGVVIGATSRIGNHVTLYQGVTLGAKNFRYGEDGLPLKLPRHPILEDGVTVYSNASILGRVTIGKGAVIGGNVWLTHSVAPGARVLQGQIQESFTDGAGI